MSGSLEVEGPSISAGVEAAAAPSEHSDSVLWKKKQEDKSGQLCRSRQIENLLQRDGEIIISIGNLPMTTSSLCSRFSL